MVPNLPSRLSGGDGGDRGLERNNGEELNFFFQYQWAAMVFSSPSS